MTPLGTAGGYDKGLSSSLPRKQNYMGDFFDQVVLVIPACTWTVFQTVCFLNVHLFRSWACLS